MAMGVVNDDDFMKEVENTVREIGKTPVVTPVLEKTIGSGAHGNQGRNEGDKNVPDFVQKIISDEATENGRKSALALASTFGISDSSVDAYISGRSSTADEKNSNRDLTQHNQERKNRIIIKARKKLNLALNQITDERLENAKLRDISGVARDMALIIKQMEPQESNEGGNKGNNVQVVVYAPKVSELGEFPRVAVNE